MFSFNRISLIQGSVAVALCIYYVWASLVYSMVRTIAADLTHKAVMATTRDKDFHVIVPMRLVRSIDGLM